MEKQSGKKDGKLIVLEDFGKPRKPSTENYLAIAKRFEKEIATVCNDKFTGGAAAAVNVASMLFRRMLVNITKQIHGPGPVGAEFITKIYDSAKADALLDWEG